MWAWLVIILCRHAIDIRAGLIYFLNEKYWAHPVIHEEGWGKRNTFIYDMQIWIIEHVANVIFIEGRSSLFTHKVGGRRHASYIFHFRLALRIQIMLHVNSGNLCEEGCGDMAKVRGKHRLLSDLRAGMKYRHIPSHFPVSYPAVPEKQLSLQISLAKDPRR